MSLPELAQIVDEAVVVHRGRAVAQGRSHDLVAAAVHDRLILLRVRDGQMASRWSGGVPSSRIDSALTTWSRVTSAPASRCRTRWRNACSAAPVDGLRLADEPKPTDATAAIG
jgi:hypothetical protein